MRRLSALLIALVALPAAARAEPVDVRASAPISTSVTIYRAPGRNGGALVLNQLGGFAVITETRRVQLPAGSSRLRFAGVVDQIIPESAIITGLPGGVIEKNQDAALLSPEALLRAARGSRITLRRTNPATGKAEMVAATIRSASEQGVVVETAQGTEGLRCSGLPETFRFDSSGEGLMARPTLSVATRSPRAVTALVTLTYLAQGFDWAANYTAHIHPDGKTLDLGGWITLANGNSVGLQSATTQIVAGGLRREYVRRFMSGNPRVIARCWPMQRTSDIPEKPGRDYVLVRPWLPQDGRESDEISVTAQRKGMMLRTPMPVMVMASAPPPPAPPVAEQLGDLKLYRVALPTTIAARQMKQTLLIDQRGVAFDRVYTASFQMPGWGVAEQSQNAVALIRTVNDKAHGLGLPLPAGTMLVDQPQFGRAMVVGEPALSDRAEGEKLELAMGSVSDITVTRRIRATATPGDKTQREVQEVEVANATSAPVAFELKLQPYGARRVVDSEFAVTQIDGVPTIRVSIPANDRLVLRYAVVDQGR